MTLGEISGFLGSIGVQMGEAQLRSMLALEPAPTAVNGGGKANGSLVAYSRLKSVFGARVSAQPRQSDWEETVFQQVCATTHTSALRGIS